jgi:hypothetical protein
LNLCYYPIYPLGALESAVANQKLFIIPTSELTGTSEILPIQNGLNTEKETKIHLNSS